MIGIVLGSGLGVLAEEVEIINEVGFKEAGLAVSTVPGHAGKFLFGKLGGTDVCLMKGRVHLYEGHGADAVGMSTVLEAIQARALGLRVVGFSCLTNWAAGMQDNLNHEEVLETGKSAARVMARLLKEVLATRVGHSFPE